MNGLATILRGDARALPMPDASVDLIVTSPPYFALRSYTDGGAHYDRQIGAERTPREYIAALMDCTREWLRVLKPSGSIWVNLGDKYSGYNNGSGKPRSLTGERDTVSRVPDGLDPHAYGVPAKSLMMLPERYRIGCVDELSLIARAVVVWSKPNGLPESVTDRVRRSHEDWVWIRKTWPDEPCPPDVVEAVLGAVAAGEISVEDGAAILSDEMIPAEGFVHLTKQPRYFSAVDEIRENHKPGQSASALSFNRPGRGTAPGQSCAPHRVGRAEQGLNALGKLPGSVWEIATEPLKVPAELGVDHFAAFPTEWPRRIILGWSPSGICTACGEGRRPIATTTNHMQRTHKPHRVGLADRHSADGREGDRKVQTATITGEACACPTPDAPTRPAVVLDPFGGTGTTALVASVLGRHGISVDMSADYCRLARWRTTDPAQRAKAARVPVPPKVHADQGDLFGELGVVA